MKFKRGPGGAFLCDEPIEGITQEIDGDTEEYYGGRYFICETMTIAAMRQIAEKFGGEFEEGE